TLYKDEVCGGAGQARRDSGGCWVCHRIEAFEHFLQTNPEFHGKVVLIQVALQTTEFN
ncbi:hypothetical protein EDD17DRAFT_1592326, partial [Pisolithus thermaeus]